jgi:hypothetical protein
MSFHHEWKNIDIGIDSEHAYDLHRTVCSACRRAIYLLKLLTPNRTRFRSEMLVYPRGISRAPLSSDVPSALTNDYKEACLVLGDSAKASAALSRRCLQLILREAAKVKPSDLSKEIDEVLGAKSLPTHLAEAVDAVRNIGNFAAHPIKSKNTGEIVDVEPGEAEWLLDVLEGLFDFYFVAPAVLQKKKDELNKKLADAGKPPMK